MRSFKSLIILTVIGGGVLGGWYFWNRSNALNTPQHRLFYGQVIDQAGRPVGGVEVVVSISETVTSDVVAGGLGQQPKTKNQFSVFTGAHGNFMITLPHPKNELSIKEVKKEGYDWVIDWAWPLPEPKSIDNHSYKFAGKLWKCPVYEPDPKIVPQYFRFTQKAINHPQRDLRAAAGKSSVTAKLL